MRTPVEVPGIMSGLNPNEIQVRLIVIIVREGRGGLVPRRARVLREQVHGRRLASGTAYLVSQGQHFAVEARGENHAVAKQARNYISREKTSVAGFGITINGFHNADQHHDETALVGSL